MFPFDKHFRRRFGRGLGREYCEAYSLEYWREGMAEGHFRRYRDRAGREVRKTNNSFPTRVKEEIQIRSFFGVWG